MNTVFCTLILTFQAVWTETTLTPRYLLFFSRQIFNLKTKRKSKCENGYPFHSKGTKTSTKKQPHQPTNSKQTKKLYASDCTTITVFCSVHAWWQENLPTQQANDDPKPKQKVPKKIKPSQTQNNRTKKLVNPKPTEYVTPTLFSPQSCANRQKAQTFLMQSYQHKAKTWTITKRKTKNPAPNLVMRKSSTVTKFYTFLHIYTFAVRLH